MRTIQKLGYGGGLTFDKNQARLTNAESGLCRITTDAWTTAAGHLSGNKREDGPFRFGGNPANASTMCYHTLESRKRQAHSRTFLPCPVACDLSFFRRDALVRSAAQRLIIHPSSSDATSASLRAETTSVPHKPSGDPLVGCLIVLGGRTRPILPRNSDSNPSLQGI